MERSVASLFNAHILGEATRLFGSRFETVRLLSDNENFVFECNNSGIPFILRVTHSSHRSAAAIRGELDFIGYLDSHGVPVVRPVHSIHGELVERIEIGDSHFLVTAFHKIPGKTIIDADACTPEIYQKWGQVLGRMHALTRYYAPPDPVWMRPEWSENDVLVRAEKYIDGQPLILGKLHDLLIELRALPRTDGAYGLAHTDLTDVNFYVYNGDITVFDFDDCEYHWLVYDIAVILFDTLPWLPRQGMGEVEFGRYFYHHFYQGYAKENSLDGYWIDLLPLFMKLRQIFLYIVFHKKWDFENLEDWQPRLLGELKRDIEEDIACLDYKL